MNTEWSKMELEITSSKKSLHPRSFIIFVAVEVEAHAVPHFETPVNGEVEPWWLECASTFSIQTSLLNLVVYYRKVALSKLNRSLGAAKKAAQTWSKTLLKG